MTTHKSEERTDSLQSRLRALCEKHKGVTAGPWELWTSNSWRRFMARDGGSVCEPVVQHGDNHPDLHFRNGGPDGPDARAIADIPTMLALLRSAADALDAARASDARPKSAEEALARQGVFAGLDGLRRFSNAAEFWECQMYGTRFYFGPGGMDYLHHGVLRAAIDALDGKPDYAARSAPIDAAAKP